MKMILLALFLMINTAYSHKNSNISRVLDYDTYCYCGWTNKNPSKIIGGVETNVGEWPMMVGILVVDELKHLCGGTIITRHHVLTASHCLFDKTGSAIPLEILGIIVGEHKYSQVDKGDVIKIREAVLHPEYITGKATPDLAILLIDNSLYNGVSVGPACLPKKRINPVNKKLRHLGWGVAKANTNRTSDVLRKAILRGVDLRNCQFGGLINWKDRFQICTRQRRTSQCLGDSGGPLMWLDPSTSKYSLIGVVSFAKDNCLDGPAVSTEIFNFIPWIKYVTSAIYEDNHVCINQK